MPCSSPLPPTSWPVLKGRKAWGQHSQACAQQDPTGHLFGQTHQIWWIPKAERLPPGSTPPPHLLTKAEFSFSNTLLTPSTNSRAPEHSLPRTRSYLFSCSAVASSSRGLNSSRSRARTLGKVSSRLAPKSPGSYCGTLNWRTSSLGSLRGQDVQGNPGLFSPCAHR